MGSVLTGRVYSLSDLTTALYEVSFTDSTYVSGAIGLLVADQGALASGNQSGQATFDNFSATAIPEPATTAWLMGLAGMLVVGCIRRRKN